MHLKGLKMLYAVPALLVTVAIAALNVGINLLFLLAHLTGRAIEKAATR